LYICYKSDGKQFCIVTFHIFQDPGIIELLRTYTCHTSENNEEQKTSSQEQKHSGNLSFSLFIELLEKGVVLIHKIYHRHNKRQDMEVIYNISTFVIKPNNKSLRFFIIFKFDNNLKILKIDKSIK
jgi:hypothetical protein